MGDNNMHFVGVSRMKRVNTKVYLVQCELIVVVELRQRETVLHFEKNMSIFFFLSEMDKSAHRPKLCASKFQMTSYEH